MTAIPSPSTGTAGTPTEPALLRPRSPGPRAQSPATRHGDAAQRRSGIGWGFAAYAFWGLITVYWKALSRFDAFELIGYRISTSALLMGCYCAATGRLMPLLHSLRDRALLGRVGLAAVMLTINWTTYVWAVVHGRVIETALGYFISPIGLTLAGVFVLHERLRPVQTASLVLAVAAVVVLTVGYGSFPWVSLVIASSWVTYSLAKKRTSLAAVESLTAETLLLVVPALAVVVWSATRSSGIAQTASPREWVLIAFAGVVTSAPLLMFALAVRRLALTAIALLQYIVPTINFLLGWLAYGEKLTVVRVIGFVLVWIGLAAVTLDSLRRMRRELPAAIAPV